MYGTRVKRAYRRRGRNDGLSKIPTARAMGLPNEHAKTAQSLFGMTAGKRVTAQQRRDVTDDWRERLRDAERLARGW